MSKVKIEKEIHSTPHTRRAASQLRRAAMAGQHNESQDCVVTLENEWVS